MSKEGKTKIVLEGCSDVVTRLHEVSSSPGEARMHIGKRTVVCQPVGSSQNVLQGFITKAGTKDHVDILLHTVPGGVLRKQ